MAFAFQAVFASTAVTIVSGSMAERTRMEAYLAFVILCTGMLYSVIVRWTWGGGFLSKLEPLPYHDFAGSGVVHLCGGVAAFVGAIVVGPRAGLYDPENIRSEIDVYTKHSYDSVVMGTIMLWFGWLGFNSGSTASMVEGATDIAAVAMVNTLVAPATSSIVSLAISFTIHSLSKLPHDDRPARFDLGYTCNALLGGLVGITAGCDATPPEWACVTGLVSACIVYYWAKFCRRI
jgi:Amt family ammonium transporter